MRKGTQLQKQALKSHKDELYKLKQETSKLKTNTMMFSFIFLLVLVSKCRPIPTIPRYHIPVVGNLANSKSHFRVLNLFSVIYRER